MANSKQPEPRKGTAHHSPTAAVPCEAAGTDEGGETVAGRKGRQRQGTAWRCLHGEQCKVSNKRRTVLVRAMAGGIVGRSGRVAWVVWAPNEQPVMPPLQLRFWTRSLLWNVGDCGKAPVCCQDRLVHYNTGYYEPTSGAESHTHWSAERKFPLSKLLFGATYFHSPLVRHTQSVSAMQRLQPVTLCGTSLLGPSLNTAFSRTSTPLQDNSSMRICCLLLQFASHSPPYGTAVSLNTCSTPSDDNNNYITDRGHGHPFSSTFHLGCPVTGGVEQIQYSRTNACYDSSTMLCVLSKGQPNAAPNLQGRCRSTISGRYSTVPSQPSGVLGSLR
ncbi:hypothetical protein M011DRAFT_455218 [Sporormia fimetaria CBS 119925]|uniref:Uncharacterized protein n=1 Tax=Sporormia fimetaria CBS 119925 TaxID=1340428 RepID=A0A6A6VKL4_9PLEO|nr:hypothetical protein M011DRAFT_455218 [Sporormia fimetaria CBS 119925]